MSFLDTTTTVKEGNMTTDLYSKPTNSNTFHPVVTKTRRFKPSFEETGI
jgi:hypothetical protein